MKVKTFSDLSVFHRVIIQIFESQPKRPGLSCPFGLTQEGISSAVDASQTFISMVLRQMMAQGLIQENKAHIEKRSRRMKVYELTPLGFQEAVKLIDGLKLRKIRISINGDINDMAIGTVLSQIKPTPSIMNIISQVNKTGLFSPDKNEIVQNNQDGLNEARIVLPNGINITIGAELVLGRKIIKDSCSAEKAGLVSSNHARIWLSNDEFYIEDGYNGIASTNGTLLNDRQIKGKGVQKLHDKDTVNLAGVVIIEIVLPKVSTKTMVKY